MRLLAAPPVTRRAAVMGTASVHKSWRKACGAIKDSATVGLAKVNSGGRERKDLDVAVVKATTHVERPPKERHLAGEIISCSPSSLAQRLRFFHHCFLPFVFGQPLSIVLLFIAKD